MVPDTVKLCVTNMYFKSHDNRMIYIYLPWPQLHWRSEITTPFQNCPEFESTSL